MPYLSAHFATQQSAMAAMDKLIGRGLGHARVQPLVERPTEPNDPPASPQDLGRARLEIMLGQPEQEAEIRALLGPLGAMDIVTSDETGTPFPTERSVQDVGGRGDVTQAIAASEDGAQGSTPP